MMETLQLKFRFEKSTPGTNRYKEIVPEGDQPCVGTLYIKKSAGPPVKALSVTIEEDTNG